MASPTRTSLNIAIIGGGIAGLSTALAITRHNLHHKVTIYESTSSLSETGAGIQMYPNATRSFRDWDMESEMIKIANLPSAMAITRYADDSLIAELPLNPFSSWQYDGLPIMQVARPDLQRLLFEACMRVEEASRAHLIFNKLVQKVDADTGTIIFEDDTQVVADLVIAADGIRSRVRTSSMPSAFEIKVRATNEYWIRATIDRSVMLSSGDSSIAALMDPHKETISWAGPHTTMLGYPIGGGAKYNIVIMIQNGDPSHDSSQGVGRWSQEGSISEVADILKEYNPRVRKLWSLVTSCKKWTIAELPPLQSYSSPNGRLILTGDAAHAIVPHAGAGGAMAIEDGAALGEFLAHIPYPSHLATFMSAWSVMRRTRVENVRRSANDSVTWLSIPDGAAQLHRDQMWGAMTRGMKLMAEKLGEEGIKGLPKKELNPDGKDMGDEGWRRYLYAYDARGEAERVVRRLLSEGGKDSVENGERKGEYGKLRGAERSEIAIAA